MVLPQYISDLGISRKYSKGSHVFIKGEEAVGFFYVVSGAIRIYRLDAEGRELEVARMGCGDFLAEVTLFAADMYPVNAEVMKDSSLLFFDKDRMTAALRTNPDVAEFMLKLLAQKCITLNERLDTLNFKNPQQRLVAYLVGSCSKDLGCKIKLDIKKVDLARHIGITPESLSRIFRHLQDENLISVDGKIINVLNCPDLKKLL